MDISREGSSRLPGFYALPVSERANIAARFSQLDMGEKQSLNNFGSLNGELVDIFIENAVGCFSLPLGIATNFCINRRDVLVPMAVEETSVVAAASHGAKLARYGGGFLTSSSDPIMTGQIQIYLEQDYDFDSLLNEQKKPFIGICQQRSGKIAPSRRWGQRSNLVFYS